MTFAEVCDFLRSNPHLKDMRIDSRLIQPGDIFIAIPGFKIDGRNFIPQAIANGAALIIAEANVGTEQPTSSQPSRRREPGPTVLTLAHLTNHLPELAAYYYNKPSTKLKLIGITGTNGKTSTSHYVAQLLQATNNPCGVMGTLGHGFLPHLQPSALTTTDCCSLQQQLNAFVATQTKYMAMEVSSIGLVQGRLQHTQFDTAVFTNLTQDHLDYHADMETYFAAKCRLFVDFVLQHAVINLDDPYAERLLKLIPSSVKIITYSLSNPQADVYLQNASHIFSPWGTGAFSSNLLGKFNIYNALAALACCALQGIEFNDLLSTVQYLQPVCGRMELISTKNINAPKVVVDYAHSPDALSNVLTTLRAYNPRQLFCVFGCGGDRDRLKRPLMLQAVVAHSDQIIITNDNPRTEDPQQIVQDILGGTTETAKIQIKLDRRQAILDTIARATAQDIVLIAGKGHEDYQIIGTTKFPFSDQLVAAEALNNGEEYATVMRTNL